MLRNRLVLRAITAALAVFLFVFFVGGGCPVLINKYKGAVENTADAYINLGDSMSADVKTILNRLNGLGKTACDDELLHNMHIALYNSRYAKDIGFSYDNTLYCTTGLGKLNTPLIEKKAQFTTKDGLDMWIDEPIMLFDFQQSGTVVKKGNFNAVINTEGFKKSVDPDVIYTVDIQKEDGSLITVKPDYRLAAPADMKNRTWLSAKGFYSFKCSDSSMVCVMTYIPMKLVGVREFRLIFGIVMLSVLSSVFISIYVKNFLKSLTRFEHRFLRGLNKESLLCYYQPIVSLDDSRVVGCEVLARWQGENGEIVSPDEFLGIVKKNGKTELFTSIIINKAFDELADIIKKNRFFKVSFNIFPVDFNFNAVSKLLDHYREVYPDITINVELTEDELVEDPDIAAHINKLRESGYIVSIDDFGTGYSSLSYLQTINVDYIKIDRSFVKDMEMGTVKSQLIPHILSIAKTVNANVIVEGIENWEQLSYLKGLGIPMAQGFLFSRPIPLDKFSELFK